jgi:hypothetical protein
MCLAKRIQESDHLTRGDMRKTERLAGSLFSPIDRRKFRAAILSTFRRLGFKKPHQHEGAKREHRDKAGQHRLDIVAVGVFEPFAHLCLPGGIG